MEKKRDKENIQIKNGSVQSSCQPLRQITNCNKDKEKEFIGRYYTNQLKIKIPNSQPSFTKTIYLHSEGQDSMGQSEIDDISKVSGIQQ